MYQTNAQIDIDFYFEFHEWEQVFNVIHYRGRVGFENGITYIIHTNESGKHNLPHLHAKYQNDEVVIELKTGKILTGSLNKTQLKRASDWVVKNDELVCKRWNELTKGIRVEIM